MKLVLVQYIDGRWEVIRSKYLRALCRCKKVKFYRYL